MKKIFLISVFFVVFFSIFTLNSNEVFAQPAECPGGLVPCGRSCDDPTTSVREDTPCSFCHIFYLTKNIIDFVLVKIVFPLAVLLLVVGGAMFLLAAGDPGKVNQGKSIMKAVVIGLLIIVAAWVIVNTFFVIIDVSDWTGLEGGWFTIICTLPPPPPVDQCNSGPDCDDSNPCTKDVCQNPTFNNSVCQNDNLLVNTDCGDCKECNPFGACSIDLCDPAIGMCFSNTCFPLYPWYIVRGSGAPEEVIPITGGESPVTMYDYIGVGGGCYHGSATVQAEEGVSMFYLYEYPVGVFSLVGVSDLLGGLGGRAYFRISGAENTTLVVADDPGVWVAMPGSVQITSAAETPALITSNLIRANWAWNAGCSDGGVISNIQTGCITISTPFNVLNIDHWKFVSEDGSPTKLSLPLLLTEQLQICKNP